jgi:hypothetical protein
MIDLELCVQTWFEVEDGFNLPLFIHIKDIEYYQPNIINKKIDVYKNELRHNKLPNPFQEQLELLEFKEEMMYYLRFIDNRKLFDDLKQTFAQYYFDANTVEELYEALMENGFTDNNLQRLKNEINFYICDIKDKFMKRVIQILDYERKFPQFVISDKMPKEYQELLQYTNEMSKFQSGIEYSNVIIFSENIGKPLIEYSWREIELKCLYISMKNKIEGFLNAYQSHKMEQSRPKDNKR